MTLKKSKILKVGIATPEEIRARTIAIAKGEYKPGINEPKVWFSSIESFAQVLSTQNKDLLALISKEKPKSMSELAQLSDRALSNLSRTLKRMASLGLVELVSRDGRKEPRALYEKVALTYDIGDVPAAHVIKRTAQPRIRSL